MEYVHGHQIVSLHLLRMTIVRQHSQDQTPSHKYVINLALGVYSTRSLQMALKSTPKHNAHNQFMV